MSGCRSQPEPRARRCNMIRSRPRQLGSAGLGSARPQRGRAAARWVSGGGGGARPGRGRRAARGPRGSSGGVAGSRSGPGGGGGGPAGHPGAVGRGGGSEPLGTGAEATLASEMRWLFNPWGTRFQDLEAVKAELSRGLFVPRSGAGSRGEDRVFCSRAF